MHYKGSEQLGLAKQFLEEFDYWNFKPNRDLITCKNGHGLHTPYTVETEEKTRISYLPEKLNGTGEYKMTKLEPGKEYFYRFFNPVTGEKYRQQKFTANEHGEFIIPRSPVMHDFVFVIEEKP